jgi:hypothetical protein
MSDSVITFSNVSRFYGEVLGINKVNLRPESPAWWGRTVRARLP